MSSNASTQLRALEGEIEQINKEIDTEGRPYGNLAWRITKSLLADRLLTIAKELEKRAIHAETQAHVAEMEVKLVKNERDAIVKAAADQHLASADRTSQEMQTIRTENATLKRRLDEAMKERDELLQKLNTANNIIDAMNEAAIDDLT